MHINKEVSVYLDAIDIAYQGVSKSIIKSLIYQWVVLALSSRSTVTISDISKMIVVPIRKIIPYFIQQTETKNYFIRMKNIA